MIKNLRYSLVILFAVICSLSYGAAYKELTFPSGNSEPISAYTKTWTATLANFTWTIENFNNNKNEWAYIKCGRKGNASVASIMNETVMEEAIGSVVVTIDQVTADKINSISLTVASDKEFKNVLETVNASEIAKGDMTFNVTKSNNNCYYKLTFDCQSGAANGLVQVSKVSYYKVGDTPEVVDITNTEATAYTVSKARELIDAGKGLATDVYVKGYITEIVEVSTEYGNATYYINDDKTGHSSDSIKVYRGNYINGEKFTAADQINVGDEVIVYGQLSLFKGTSYQISGSKIVSITTGINEITFDEATKEKTIYNLAGQRMEKMQKGINIINGKKYVVK